MIRLKSMRPSLAILVAAVLIVAAGGAVIASNMGFKMNKPLVRVPTGAATLTGNNWTSIPFHNPYGTIQGFCNQTGLTSTGFSVTGISTLNYNEPPFSPALSGKCSNQASLPCPATASTNSFCSCTTDADCPAVGTGSPFFCAEGPKNFNCGSAGASAQSLISGKGFQIRQPAAGVSSIIIVGSHNSGQQIQIKKNVNYWYSVPYHTTAVNTNDLCTQLGLTATGFGPAGITRLIPGPPAAPQSTTCGSTTTVFNLVLGEMIQVREPTKTSVTFTPAHY
ncbi:MAG TPA: hypothetical protein VGV60_11350 [Candidatus Polarisedimenticolia bacterium]|jgi:hypothetical protein|nr:hypothetical protein [Candidatus Polarisedimenticolia bacterium]